MAKAHWTGDPRTPKRVTFTATLRRRFDAEDGLTSSLAPVRDGLQIERPARILPSGKVAPAQIGCGLIHHDGVTSGHLFVYRQQVGKQEGVQVMVEEVQDGNEMTRRSDVAGAIDTTHRYPDC